MAEHADYARNLLATKEQTLAVEVIAKTADLPTDAARQGLAELGLLNPRR